MIAHALTALGCACGNTDSDPGAGGAGTGGAAGADAAVDSSSPSDSGGSDSASGGTGGQPPDAGADADAADELLAPPCGVAPATHAKARGLCDSNGWCWENPLPAISARAAWGASDDDVWVVFDTGIAHWDGNAWSVDSAIAGSGIWGSAPDDVWVVAPASKQLHHYDGTSWTSTTTPVPLTRIHGTAKDSIWVVSDELSNQTAHYDGANWSYFPGPTFGQAPDTIQSTGPKDLWTLTPGQSSLNRFDGAVWTQVFKGTSPHTLWAASVNDVWVGHLNGLVRWDGTQFQPFATPSSKSVSLLTGSSGNDVWTIDSPGVTHHWNGASWTTFNNDKLNYTDQRRLWMMGTTPWLTGEAPVRRWSGTEWSTFGVGTPDFTDMWGSSWDDVWAVSSTGTVAHFDGTAWEATAIKAGTERDYKYAIWGRSPNDVWAGGHSGSLLHYDGVTWSEVLKLGSIVEIGGTDSDLWVLTFTGEVHRIAGNTIAQTFKLPTSYATSLWVGGPEDIWVVGVKKAYRFDGTGFALVGIADALQQVWGRSRHDIWFGGSQAGLGKVSRYDGTQVTSYISPVGHVQSIWGCGANELWIAGEQGLARFSEATNTFEKRGPTIDLLSSGGSPVDGAGAVWGVSPDHIVAVGTQGSIVRLAK